MIDSLVPFRRSLTAAVKNLFRLFEKTSPVLLNKKIIVEFGVSNIQKESLMGWVPSQKKLCVKVTTLYFRRHGSLYVWVRGLGSVPDVPHAANVSFVTEGSGVGVLKEPPVNVKVVNTDSCYGYSSTLTSEAQNASNLCFIVKVATNVEVAWETIYADKRLFVEIPSSILPEGSKESLITLLEYAEEELDCNHVILVFKKSRTDRASLIRTFMFLGFEVVVPGNPIVPNADDLMFLAYTIDNYDSD